MDRRKFLKGLAATTAAAGALPKAGMAGEPMESSPGSAESGLQSGHLPDVDGHTELCEFKLGSETWKVYEDLRTRDGAITYISSDNKSLVLPKTAEATFPGKDPPYLGLSLKEIGLSGPDLLAERLLQNGDPDPAQVISAAPPLESPAKHFRFYYRLPWNTFVGTRECFDTMPVYPAGGTRTYNPIQYFPDINEAAAGRRFEGLLGAWMPAVRKVMPISESAHNEVVVFGDVQAHDTFIVQTWHRTARIENGRIVKVVYGHSYPDYPPRREAPAPQGFYRALLEFAVYWKKLLSNMAPASLPHQSWLDMSRYAFVKELMVRPGGVHPKYGAVDRDYYGPEYEGFQDIFTMATYANLEWGRFEMARAIIDNYFSDYVNAKGMINMRGPETAQFGMELMLLAKYWKYTRDSALLLKHREKIQATASLITQLHDESLRLPQSDPSHGLIRGWCESDSCLGLKPMMWWLPYFSNSAFAARGLEEISRIWPAIHQNQPASGVESSAADWKRRSKVLRVAVIKSMDQNVQHERTPPYIGPFPGAKLTFWESMQKERPSPQQWVHRAYAELLQADVLPQKLANLVINCMRNYGATTLGIVANVEPPHPRGRDILGFISYGYAQMLLRLDRIEEYLLFLYSHRYHDHTRGSWTAGEVAGITGGPATFCIPAQQTIPLLVRWMLVLEDSDQEILYFGKGLPRDWVLSGKELSIHQAPTRWGRVNFKMLADLQGKQVRATVELPRKGVPREIQVKFRLPASNQIREVEANGRKSRLGGLHRDSAIIPTAGRSHFEVVCNYD